MLSGNMFKEVYTKYNFSPISLSYNIPDDAIHKICKLIQDGVSISDISSQCGVDKYFINDIKNRYIHQNISINYDFRNA